ncbi:MAG: thioredoxin family protein [Flavobacteriales bacterium]|nr:thioredoxin family protein [Flavobacteriales bacterium]
MTTTSSIQVEYRIYLSKAITYADYRRNMGAEIASGVETSTSSHLPLNESRMRRIEKTYVPGEAARARIAALDMPLDWLVLSEHWCGDAAQILPVMNALAALSGGLLRLSLVYRDANLDLMDAHLTGTSRSIPKLIQLNVQHEVIATWGPRPAEAQALVIALKSDPATATDYKEPLHAWYAKDKQQAIERELIALLPGI